MRNREPPLDRESILKIDKDCLVDKEWVRDYVRLTIQVCRLKGVRVVRMQKSLTRRGFHLYVTIAPAVKPELANRLQFLLGDDCGRIDHNRARIRSGLRGWNKLFERPNGRLSTIYRSVDAHVSHGLVALRAASAFSQTVH